MVREKSRHARHLSEFELIERFFTHRARAQPERAAAIDNAEAPPRRPLKTALGIGDDCALINDTDDAQLAISTDMLVEGRHFFSNVDPRALGHSARGQFVRSGRNGRGAARIYPRACAAGGARRLARAVFRRRVRARRSIRMRTDWRRYDGGAAHDLHHRARRSQRRARAQAGCRARAMMSGYPAGSAMRGWRSADGAVNGRLRIALGRAFSARSTGRSRGLRLAARSPELRTQRLICPTDSRAI